MRWIFFVFLLFAPVYAMASENLIEILPLMTNAIITDGVVYQNGADPRTYMSWKIQAIYNNTKYLPYGPMQSYIGLVWYEDTRTGFMSCTFTTPDDLEDLSYFRFGLNGVERDTLIHFNIKDIMPSTTYTLQWRVLNTTQGEVAWTDMFLTHCGDGYALESGDETCSRTCENQVVAGGHIPPDAARVYEPEICTYDPARLTCDGGYYLEDNECKRCPGGYYCPGNDAKVQCPANTTDFGAVFASTEYSVIDWHAINASYCFIDNPAASIDRCCLVINISTSIGWFEAEGELLDGQYQGRERLRWYAAHPGYYLSGYLFSSGGVDWYADAKACTNAPENAHYTAAGTPDETRSGGATDYNDCPWKCNDGYGKTSDGQCVHLCTAGITEIHVGDVAVPLYSVQPNTPAINVLVPGHSVCYGSLVPGQANGALNVRIGDVIYHSVR